MGFLCLFKRADSNSKIYSQQWWSRTLLSKNVCFKAIVYVGFMWWRTHSSMGCCHHSQGQDWYNAEPLWMIWWRAPALSYCDCLLMVQCQKHGTHCNKHKQNGLISLGKVCEWRERRLVKSCWLKLPAELPWHSFVRHWRLDVKILLHCQVAHQCARCSKDTMEKWCSTCMKLSTIHWHDVLTFPK